MNPEPNTPPEPVATPVPPATVTPEAGKPEVAAMHYPEGYVAPSVPAAAAADVASSGAPVSNQIGVSGSGLGTIAAGKRPRHWTKIFLIIGGIVAVLVAGLLVLGWYLTTLQPTTYKNNQGKTFKLVYYPFSRIMFGDPTVSNQQGGSNKDNPDSRFLVEGVPDERKMKLTLKIDQVKIAPQFNEVVCKGHLFQVRIKALDLDAPVCGVDNLNTPIVYLFTFKSQDKIYTGQIFLKYPKDISHAEAQRMIDEEYLLQREPAIRRIIASIAPQQ